MSQKKEKIKKLKEKELNAILDSNNEANIENPIKDEDVVEVINDKETLDYINEDYPPPITKYDDPQVSPFEIYVVYNHDNMGNYYLKTPSDLDENNPLRDSFRVVRVQDQYLTQKSKDLLPAKLPPPPRSSDLLPPDQTCEAAHPKPEDKSITHDPEIARRCKKGSIVLIEDIYGDRSLPPEQRYTIKGKISYKDTENARQISRLNSDGEVNMDEDMDYLALNRIKWIPPPEPEPSAIEKAGQVAPSGETVPGVAGQPAPGQPVQGVPVPPVVPVPAAPVPPVVQGVVVPPVVPAVPPVVQGVPVPPVPPVVQGVPAPVVQPAPAAAQAVQSGVIQATKGGKTKKKRKTTKKRTTKKKTTKKRTTKKKTTKKRTTKKRTTKKK